MNAAGAISAARMSTRSRRRATPVRRKMGDSDAASRTRPRASGSRLSASGGRGIRPSRTVPSVPANAQYRSLTITTPFGRAIPPRRGSSADTSARARIA